MNGQMGPSGRPQMSQTPMARHPSREQLIDYLMLKVSHQPQAPPRIPQDTVQQEVRKVRLVLHTPWLAVSQHLTEVRGFWCISDPCESGKESRAGVQYIWRSRRPRKPLLSRWQCKYQIKLNQRFHVEIMLCFYWYLWYLKLVLFCVCFFFPFMKMYSTSQYSYLHYFQGIFVTRVQPEGPASKVLQPGDKIIQVQINFWTTHPPHVFYNKTCFSLPGQWIQLCEYWSWLRSVPPEDLSKHCGFDDHQRRAGIDSADVWMGAHKETAKTLVLNLVFFYTETDLLGLFILMELGKPLNVVD